MPKRANLLHVLERVERGGLARDELHAWLDAALRRAADRALFELPARPTPMGG
ncbi:MAG: hypothetical protein ACREUT_17970 [Steroidobacteraceae bacterium]